MESLQRDPRTFEIIGAAMEVHRELGSGFLEATYQEALALELHAREVPFTREPPVPIRYKGKTLGVPYRADFICYESVIVELKALKRLTAVEEAQIIHYLRATGLEVGLLLNFGGPSLEHRRFVYTQSV